jgi:hypothetical protein
MGNFEKGVRTSPGSSRELVAWVRELSATVDALQVDLSAHIVNSSGRVDVHPPLQMTQVRARWIG